MTYRIEGLAPERFSHLFGLDDAALAAAGAVRVRADTKPGFPCRITLEDAEPGETLLLIHHTDHDVDTPYRNSFAIFVREGAREAAVMQDRVPPVMAGRPLALRGYDANGNLRCAALAVAGEADAGVRQMLARDDVAYIHAHNAAHGCFAARIERS